MGLSLKVLTEKDRKLKRAFKRDKQTKNETHKQTSNHLIDQANIQTNKAEN